MVKGYIDFAVLRGTSVKCSFTANKKREEHGDSIVLLLTLNEMCLPLLRTKLCFLCINSVSINLQPIDTNLSID